MVLAVVWINEISGVSYRSGRRRTELRKDKIDSGVTARGDLGARNDESAANIVFREQMSE